MTEPHWTAFTGHKCIAADTREAVARAVKKAHDKDPTCQIVILDDATGRLIDIDLRGSSDDVVARIGSDADSTNESAARSVGRPRLGVTAREVTLLPRHWDWLAQQSGGASGTLRRLVDAARTSASGRRQQAQASTDRFMSTIAGDLPGYEDASRALYAIDAKRFKTLISKWPRDVRSHALRLASSAFELECVDTAVPPLRATR